MATTATSTPQTNNQNQSTHIATFQSPQKDNQIKFDFLSHLKSPALANLCFNNFASNQLTGIANDLILSPSLSSSSASSTSSSCANMSNYSDGTIVDLIDKHEINLSNGQTSSYAKKLFQDTATSNSINSYVTPKSSGTNQNGFNHNRTDDHQFLSVQTNNCNNFYNFNQDANDYDMNNLVGSILENNNSAASNGNASFFLNNSFEQSPTKQFESLLTTQHDQQQQQQQEQKAEQEYFNNMLRKRFNSCSIIDFSAPSSSSSSSALNLLNKNLSFDNNNNSNATPSRMNSFGSANNSSNSNNSEMLALSNSLSSSSLLTPPNYSPTNMNGNSSGVNAQNYRNFRHNSIIGSYNNYSNQNNHTGGQNREQRALSFSFNNNNNNNGFNGSIGNNASSSANTFLFSQNENSFSNNQQQLQLNSASFNNNKSEPHSNSNTFPCLSPNCQVMFSGHNEKNFDQNLIKFGCSSCQTIRFMHRLCYDKAYLEQLSINTNLKKHKNLTLSKSFDANKYQEQQVKVTIKFNCSNCLNGVLKVAYNNHQNHYPKIASSSSLNQGYLSMMNNGDSSQIDSSNRHSQLNDSPSMYTPMQSSSMMLRKKSLCLNNPPLPVPMQPVRESRSPSPTSNLNNNNTSQNSYAMNQSNFKLNKRQSAPVNVPKNRYRTMSTGSTGSFSASSSFSSSIGTSFTIGSPSVNNPQWKKFANQANNNNSSIINHGANLAQSSNSINNLANMSANNISNQEANIKSDADCLNNMVLTMASKLNLSNTENLEEKLASTGNIFYNRDDWSIFQQVPFAKQNSIHLRLEDEGPYGNDDTRCFVLSHFSTLCIREMRCVVCDVKMNIYGKFPLVDGTLFVSPVKYDELNGRAKQMSNSDECLKEKEEAANEIKKSVPAMISNRNQHIYAICLDCLHGKNNHEIKCKYCKKPWTGGSSLQIGTMYKYEIFAAFPCCQKRANCTKCDYPIVNLKATGGLQYFSSYSEEKECSNCKCKDYHFIKPLDQLFDIPSFKNSTPS